ncbi:hypothetical protein T484DRAFT_1832491, partial [Baffinella frigidus]
VDGKPHKHAFTKTTSETRHAEAQKHSFTTLVSETRHDEVEQSRGSKAVVKGAIKNLIVLKSTM